MLGKILFLTKPAQTPLISWASHHGTLRSRSKTLYSSHLRKILDEEETADVSYQAAMASALISILYQTIEAVQDFRSNGPQLAKYISNNSFQTKGGNIAFDENGQSKAPSLILQYDAKGELQIFKKLSVPLLYPMPTWDRRDCINRSKCEGKNGNDTDSSAKSKNVCHDDGTYVCDDKFNFKPIGSGATANCIDMNYIDHSLEVFSWILCGFLLLFCVFALGWIYWYRENTLVKVSQPLFLGLLVIGSILSSLSIILMGAETSYRDAGNIKAIDAACMAVPWLYGMVRNMR